MAMLRVDRYAVVERTGDGALRLAPGVEFYSLNGRCLNGRFDIKMTLEDGGPFYIFGADDRTAEAIRDMGEGSGLPGFMRKAMGKGLNPLTGFVRGVSMKADYDNSVCALDKGIKERGDAPFGKPVEVVHCPSELFVDRNRVTIRLEDDSALEIGSRDAAIVATVYGAPFECQGYPVRRIAGGGADILPWVRETVDFQRHRST